MSELPPTKFLPVKAEDGQISYSRKAVSDLTQKDKIYLEKYEALQEQARQLAKDFVEEETFAVEGTQLNEA